MNLTYPDYPPIDEAWHALLRRLLLAQDVVVAFNIAVYYFAMVANVVVAVVFFKSGFHSTSNISFFALAISDTLVSVGWLFDLMTDSVTYDAYGENYMSVILFSRFFNAYFLPCFDAVNTIGSWITAVITWERLCCIVFPLKVKRIFSRKVVVGLILGFVLYEVLVMSVFYIGRFLWYTGRKAYLVELRKGNYGEPPYHYTLGMDLADAAELVGFYIPNYVFYSAIVIGTVLLVVMFWRSVQLKKSLTGNTDKQNVSARDARLIKSVLGVCIIYIVTCTPQNIMESMQRIKYLLGQVYNTYPLMLELPLCLRSFNYAGNIFIYLKMNSTFRKRFKELFCCVSKTKRDPPSSRL